MQAINRSVEYPQILFLRLRGSTNGRRQLWDAARYHTSFFHSFCFSLLLFISLFHFWKRILILTKNFAIFPRMQMKSLYFCLFLGCLGAELAFRSEPNRRHKTEILEGLSKLNNLSLITSSENKRISESGEFPINKFIQRQF